MSVVSVVFYGKNSLIFIFSGERLQDEFEKLFDDLERRGWSGRQRQRSRGVSDARIERSRLNQPPQLTDIFIDITKHEFH